MRSICGGAGGNGAIAHNGSNFAGNGGNGGDGKVVICFGGAGGNVFPKTVCAPHERPVDSIGRYEKAKIAKLMQLGGWAGGGGQ